jgi:hypothetical protein
VIVVLKEVRVHNNGGIWLIHEAGVALYGTTKTRQLMMVVMGAIT